MQPFSEFGKAYKRSEHRSARRSGLEAEVRFLRAHLERLRAEGNNESTYLMLYELFRAYVSEPRITPSILKSIRSLLREMDAVPPPSPQLPLYISNALFAYVSQPKLALKYVRLAFDLAVSSRDSMDQRYAIPALRLELAVLARHYPKSKRLGKIMWQLQDLLSPHTLDDCHRMETLRLLAEIEPRMWGLRRLVIYDWANLRACHHLEGRDFANEIDELEELARRLPSPEDDDEKDS